MWAQLGIEKVMLLLMYGRFSRRMAQSAHVYSASKLASHLISTNWLIFFVSSKLHALGKLDSVQKYSGGTSTTGLRNHLATEHLEEWVDSCGQFNIKISGKEAKVLVANLWQRCGEHVQEPAVPGEWQGRQPYSNEAFIDAIVAWIVGDDQVRLVLLLLGNTAYIITVYCSHWQPSTLEHFLNAQRGTHWAQHTVLQHNTSMCHRNARRISEIFSQGDESNVAVMSYLVVPLTYV